MGKRNITLLDETVEYFDYGDFVRAVIFRTDPDTGKREIVDEFALTLHAIESSLYGPNGKVAAAQRLRDRLAAQENVVPIHKNSAG